MSLEGDGEENTALGSTNLFGVGDDNVWQRGIDLLRLDLDPCNLRVEIKRPQVEMIFTGGIPVQKEMFGMVEGSETQGVNLQSKFDKWVMR